MAGVLGPHRADHPYLRRDHVELLGGVLADAHQRVAACTLLVLLGQVDELLDSRQHLWQRSAPRALASTGKHLGGRLIRGRLILASLVLGGFAVGAVFDLIEQPDLQPLGGGELFGAASVQLGLEPRHLFFVEIQLLVQLPKFRVQLIVPGDQLTVFRRQLLLFQDQAALVLTQRIAFFGDR